MRMDRRWHGDDTNEIPTLVQELVGPQPDIIVTGGIPATATLSGATETIPIVFAVVSDPVASSIRGSTARVETSPASRF
jgi:putative ABC transport system substrate-binding protein